MELKFLKKVNFPAVYSLHNAFMVHESFIKRFSDIKLTLEQSGLACKCIDPLKCIIMGEGPVLNKTNGGGVTNSPDAQNIFFESLEIF